jgi:POT family proton-dependent oligopeptide transporter
MFAGADQRPTAASGAAAGESLAPLFVECLIPAVLLALVGCVVAMWLQNSLPAALQSLLPASPPRDALPEAVQALSPPTLAFLAACVPVILFYVRVWRSVPDQADRRRVMALLIIMCIAIVFWMTYGLNTTALNVWSRDATNRELTGPVRLITDQIPVFAENAGPEYYNNAGPEVPRPDPDTFKIVTPEQYKELSETNQLSVREGQKLPVTQEMFDKVYAPADPNGSRLPEGKHLHLINPELFQSINPGLIILFTPLVVFLWHFLRARGLEPSTAAKMGVGLLLSALAPTVMLGATLVSHDGATKASPAWLFGTYGAVGLGELFLSSMGLSLVNKMSPAAIRAFMMGGWFLSTSLGLKISGLFGEAYARRHTEIEHEQFWGVLIAANVVCALFIFLLLPWLNRQMAGEAAE